MAIETKYNARETVFFMNNNKAVSGVIQAISVHARFADDERATPALAVRYWIDNVEFNEHKLFPTKEVLLATL